MVTAALLTATLCLLEEPASAEDLEAREAPGVEIFEDACTHCHDEGGDPTDPGDLNLEVPPNSLVGQRSVVVDRTVEFVQRVTQKTEEKAAVARLVKGKGIAE